MSTHGDKDDVESEMDDGIVRSEDVIVIPEDRQQLLETVRQSLRFADTDRGSTTSGMSAPTQWRSDEIEPSEISIDQETAEGAVPIKSIGGSETRSTQEDHLQSTGGITIYKRGTQDMSRRQLQVHRGDSQALATMDEHPVFNIQEVNLYQSVTNVKFDHCLAASVGDNCTVTSGTELKTLTPQAHEELKAMRESTSRRLRDWTTGMVNTKAVDVLAEQLSKGPSVYILKGSPGEGKTTVANMALKKLQDKGREVFVVETPSEYFTVKSVKKSVILLNDIFGDLHFHLDNVSRWEKVFVNYLALQEHKDTTQPESKPTVLLVSRSSVLESAGKHLGRFKSLILNKDCTMDLTKDMDYTVEEKVKIWSEYAHRNNVHIEERIVRGVCEMMDLPHGFPHCCRLFAKMYSQNQKIQMEMFFRNPVGFLQQDMKTVFEDKIAGKLLRHMLENGGKCREDFYTKSSEKSFNIKKTINKYEGLYFRKEGNVVTFHHPSIYDTVAFIACEECPLFVVEHCTMAFLNDRVRLADLYVPEAEQQETINIGSFYTHNFMNRMKNEIEEGNISGVLSHASFHDEDFAREFMDTIVSEKFKHNRKGRHRFPKTNTQAIHDLIHIRDKKTDDAFLFLCSKNKSNRILQYVCESVPLNQEDQTSVMFGICNHRSEPSLQYFLETFPECDLSVKNERRETLLIIAAKNPCDYILRTLMERGVSVQEEDASGNTALHYVCEYGVEKDPSLVEMMVRKREDVNKCNRHKKEPLAIACEAGHNEIITHLLRMGANINGTGDFVVTPLTAACRRGLSTIVSTLLDGGADRNKQDRWGETPLTVACREGFNTVVKMLLDRDADTNKPNSWAETPLIAASRAGHNTLVITLLDRGANINQSKLSGETSLTIALKKRHKTVVATLLQRGADINQHVCFGKTPLTHEINKGDNTEVTILLDFEADINKADERGEKPLTAACRRGLNIIVNTLLDRGADKNELDGLEETPLTAACKRGHDTVVTTLLDKGTAINSPDGRGETPLTAACRGDRNNVVTILLNRGADRNSPDELGEPPLTAACKRGHDTVVTTLLDKGTAINSPDGRGETPLTAACRGGRNNVVTILLNRGADRNSPDGLGETPLTAACRRGHDTVVTTLLDKGAAINSLDGQGETPLTATCIGGHETVVIMLLDRDADINKPNRKGETPLDIARRHGHNTVCTTLLYRKGKE